MWAVTTVTDTHVCGRLTIYVSVFYLLPPVTLPPASEAGVTESSLWQLRRWRSLPGDFLLGCPWTNRKSWAGPWLPCLGCVALGWLHRFSETRCCHLSHGYCGICPGLEAQRRRWRREGLGGGKDQGGKEPAVTSIYKLSANALSRL